MTSDDERVQRGDWRLSSYIDRQVERYCEFYK